MLKWQQYRIEFNNKYLFIVLNIKLDVKLGEYFNKLLNRLTGESLDVQWTSKKALMVVRRIKS